MLIKMNKISLIVLSIALSISACSIMPSKPLSPEEEKARREEAYRKDYTDVATHIITLKGQEVKIIDRLYHPHDIRNSRFSIGEVSEPNLVIIQRSNTVGTTALATLATIASIFSFNSQPIDGFSKHELRGSEVEPKFPNPVFDYLSPKIRTWVSGIPVQDEGRIAKNIYIQPGRFYLVYEKLSGGDKYLLHNEVHLRMTFSNLGGMKEPDFSCVKEADGHSLEDWRKDGYALVRQTVEKQFDECLEQFKAKQEQLIKSLYIPTTAKNNG